MTQTNLITCSLKEEFAVKYLALPTKKQLEKLFDWDENGSLRWKKNGLEAGWIENNNYYRVEINNNKYQKHRILFVLYYGNNKISGKQIDHVDGNPSNNAKSNLRIEYLQYKNIWNQKKRINNTSGCKGVSWDKRVNKWRSEICINGKNKLLAYSDNFIYACVVRRRAAKLYHGDWRRD